MKKVYWLLIVFLFTSTIYYFFIRDYEYRVNFSANTLPGDLIETIRIWNRSLKDAHIHHVDSLSALKQTIVLDDVAYLYSWRFHLQPDATTKVSVFISEPSRSLINKVLVPFTNQQIEVDAERTVRNFHDILKKHLEITRVEIKGEVKMDSSFCVCSTIETSQIEKANGMMRDYSLLSSFVDDHKLTLNGMPSVQIQRWHHSKGELKFDFCFPIHRSDNLPQTSMVQYKTFLPKNALKAEYYGNYITSDRAWYELIEYANKNGYKIEGAPIEYFFDNPNLGVSETEWRADIYLPVSTGN